MNGDLRASAVSRKLERVIHIMFRRNKHGTTTTSLSVGFKYTGSQPRGLVEL